MVVMIWGQRSFVTCSSMMSLRRRTPTTTGGSLGLSMIHTILSNEDHEVDREEDVRPAETDENGWWDGGVDLDLTWVWPEGSGCGGIVVKKDLGRGLAISGPLGRSSS